MSVCSAAANKSQSYVLQLMMFCGELQGTNNLLTLVKVYCFQNHDARHGNASLVETCIRYCPPSKCLKGSAMSESVRTWDQDPFLPWCTVIGTMFSRFFSCQGTRWPQRVVAWEWQSPRGSLTSLGGRLLANSFLTLPRRIRFPVMSTRPHVSSPLSALSWTLKRRSRGV